MYEGTVPKLKEPKTKNVYRLRDVKAKADNSWVALVLAHLCLGFKVSTVLITNPINQSLILVDNFTQANFRILKPKLSRETSKSGYPDYPSEYPETAQTETQE